MAQHLVSVTYYLPTESKRCHVVSKLQPGQSRIKREWGKAKDQSDVFQLFLNCSVIILFLLSQMIFSDFNEEFLLFSCALRSGRNYLDVLESEANRASLAQNTLNKGLVPRYVAPV